MKYLYITLITLFIYSSLSAQDAGSTNMTDSMITLKEAVVSVNKVAETKKTVAQQVQVLSAKEIESIQAPTTADVLSNTGNIALQKSQQGGGSPIIRGFEANKVLLVIDGVRMNNLIYRAGHLQNIITTDNAIMDRVEVLYGPSSTIYGSDALGGVVHLYTKNPFFSSDSTMLLKVNAFARMGSVNKEKTGHVDFNLGWNKFASLTSFTYSDFDDLLGGMNTNPYYGKAYGERPYYAERINNKDSVVKNYHRYLQVQTGYSQYDLLQKFSFKPGLYITHGVNLQYSTTSDLPRYDRLTLDKSRTVVSTDGTLGSAEWYYGPQKRLMGAYDLNRAKADGMFQNIHFGLSYQDIEESRHNRNFGNNFLTHRVENVNVMQANLDFLKIVNTHDMRFGVNAEMDNLESTATRDNIVVDTTSNWSTRYPDGDNTMNTYAVYWSHTWRINNELTLNDGIRVGYATLHSTLKDTVRPPDPLPAALPYSDIDQSSLVYSGSLGLISSPTDDLKLSAMVSTGFRVPNLDDVTKFFDPAPGTVIVPNEDLKPERTINYEAGMTNIMNGKTRIETFIYYTDIVDAIVTRPFTYQGEDSILYDGTLSAVYANQNKGRAYIYGISSNLRSQCSEHLTFGLSLNYTYGRVKTDSADAPLDHIPPFVARLQFDYAKDKFGANFFINYNAWKRLKDYGGGEDNLAYATPDGMPAWYTLNLHMSYKVHKLITLQAGVDNILDTQYRTFASGINAPGRNVFGAIRFHY